MPSITSSAAYLAGSMGRSARSCSGLEISLIEDLGCFEVAGVSRHHEVRIDQQGRRNWHFCVVQFRIPESIKDLGVSVGCKPHSSFEKKFLHSAARVDLQA